MDNRKGKNMNIENVVKKIIAEVKKIDVNELNFMQDENFIEKINLDSFEVVHFVSQLDSTFKIEFGAESTDFDSLKSWSALLSNLNNKIKITS